MLNQSLRLLSASKVRIWLAASGDGFGFWNVIFWLLSFTRLEDVCNTDNTLGCQFAVLIGYSELLELNVYKVSELVVV